MHPHDRPPVTRMEKALEERMLELLQQAHANVERVGWHVTAVFATEDEPGLPWQYTVGLGETYDHPELLVVGLAHEQGHAIIASAVDLIKSGERLKEGVRTAKVLGGDLDARFVPIPADELGDWCGFGRRYYRDFVPDKPLRVWQLVWPDTENRFPWEPGFDKQRFPEPVIGGWG